MNQNQEYEVNAHILDRDLTSGGAMRAIAAIHVAPHAFTDTPEATHFATACRMDARIVAEDATRAMAHATSCSTSNAFDAEHADRTRERPTHQHKHKTHTHTLHAHHTHHTHHPQHEHDTTPTSVATERNAPRY